MLNTFFKLQFYPLAKFYFDAVWWAKLAICLLLITCDILTYRTVLQHATYHVKMTTT